MEFSRHLTASIAALLLASIASQARDGWFAWAPYGHSLYSDTHPDMCRLDMAGVTMDQAYDYDRSGRNMAFHMMGGFGFNLPTWSRDIRDGKFGFSITMPMSVILWMDISEPVTAAVMNTDFRVGGPTLTFIHRIERSGFLRNYSVYAEPFKHESTHIGDELVLHRKSEGYAISRANVSYNFAEVRFTLNEPESRSDQYHTFRASLMIPYMTSYGWYVIEERDGQTDQVPGGNTRINKSGRQEAHGPRISVPEWYVQYQWQSKTAGCGIQGIVSAELRGRAVYGYDLGTMSGAPATTATKDSYGVSVNSFFGIRYNGGGDGYLSRAAFGIRAYYGNCPYGMFRSIRGYSQIGACLIIQ